MGLNRAYAGPGEMPGTLPVFPLAGALLLPRGQLPLNIFEPRYLAMFDEAIRSHRLIGMVQPSAEGGRGAPPLHAVGCAGRITQLAETGDGRLIVTLTGIARFRILAELAVTTPYRQAQADFAPFADDFRDPAGDAVDRAALVETMRHFVEAFGLKIDWKSVDEASDEALVNGLSMMCPFGPPEKQALLEARTLKLRGDVLVAIAEVEMARARGQGSGSLQ